MKQLQLVIWLILLFSNIIFAENSPEGYNKWINHTDLKNVTTIAVNKQTSIAFCGTSGGLFVVDLANSSILKKYTNIEGLLNNNVTSVYLDSLNRLWIGAIDGSISILNYESNSFKYIYDILNSGEINRSINDFVQYGKFIYVATGYGIQKLSVSNFSFVDAPYYQLGTFPSKTKVLSLAIRGSEINAGTSSGFAFARITNTNLNNPQSWTTYNSIPLSTNVISTEVFDNKVFIGSQSGFMYYDGNDFFPYPNSAVANQNIKDIKTVGNKLYFIAGNSIFYAYANNLSAITQYNVQNNYLSLANYKNDSLIAGVFEKGINYFYNNAFVNIFPNSPNRSTFDWASIDNTGALWVAGGQSDAGFYKFDGNVWTNYTTDNYPEIGRNWFRRIVSGNSETWALGFGGGPTLIKGNTIKNYNTSNSNLPGINSDTSFVATFGGAYDNNGRMWFSFFESNKSTSLYAFNTEMSFYAFPNPSFILNSSLGQIAIDNYNTKWIVTSYPTGLYFFNENNTLENLNDDIYGFYNTSDFNAGVSTITGVIVEKNNEVWVSTNYGVYMITNPYKAIQTPNNKPTPIQLQIISGNLKVPFTENCTCLTNDILNQKWIGTKSNGVFHMSADGFTLIGQFNLKNSPIISNDVSAIVTSNTDGKAYICSNNGLSVLQTDAVAPLVDFDKIVCSPNPYIIPSSVNIKIDGLVENSSIKILSISGDLVAEFESPGGRIANWDGKDKKGKYVPSGIYIVVGFTKDGNKVGKGKIAIINK